MTVFYHSSQDEGQWVAFVLLLAPVVPEDSLPPAFFLPSFLSCFLFSLDPIGPTVDPLRSPRLTIRSRLLPVRRRTPCFLLGVPPPVGYRAWLPPGLSGPHGDPHY